MKRIITALFVLALIAFPAYAQIWYLLITPDQLDGLMTRLDVLKGPSPYTLHYTAPIDSPYATVTTKLLPVDERAQTVLTPEEWASILATMPVEFQRQIH